MTCLKTPKAKRHFKLIVHFSVNFIKCTIVYNVYTTILYRKRARKN